MTLSPGTRLGPYEITAFIGAGGMGEVYRATDTNVKRQVALKVLPEGVAGDADRLARFQREAEVLASLSHPNIAALYGLERGDRMTALVMELVDGATLADRIAEGSIRVDDALAIARQIAEALEAAHERGVVHRDLKPANVKVRPDGTVKVLDFGLAKAIDSAVPSGQTAAPAITMSPTITTPAMTQAGVILGTAAYMSPEQAKGKPASKRSDVWSFGAVLYEMLAGRRPFDGEDMVDVLGAVARMEPDWSALPRDVPTPVVTLLKAALVKDPRRRLSDMSSVSFVLNHLDSLIGVTNATEPHAGAHWRRRAGALAAAAFVLGGAVAGVSVWLARPVPAPVQVTRSTISLHADTPLSGEGVALSPDGRTLVVPAGNRLVVRRLDRDELVALPGTEGATTPFFSPDGVWVGFVANTQLHKIRLDGSNPTTIARVLPSVVSGRPTWNRDDTILYGLIADGLFRVPAGGGAPERLTTPRKESKEVGHSDPQLLPGGRSVLFTVQLDDRAVGAILDPDTREWRILPQVTGGGATYVDPGYVVFVDKRTLLASRFDLATGTPTGSPVPVVDDIGLSFAVAPNGTLAFRSSGGEEGLLTVRGRIQIADRRGRATMVAPESPVTMEGGSGLAFNPKDSSRFLATLREPDPSSPAHIWLYDLMRPGTRLQLTSEGYINGCPTWNAEGTSFAYVSIRNPMGIYAQAVEPGAAATLLQPRDNSVNCPQSWAAEGRLVFNALSNAGMDVGVLERDGRASLLISTPAVESGGRLSPDGRWLAYQSDVSSQMEVYVRPFRGDGRAHIISRGGGGEPRWVGTRELVYRRGKKVVSVPVAPSGAQLNPGQERELFEIDDYPMHYDVSSDGATFLFLRREAQPAGTKASQVHLVLNWPQDLKRLVR